MITLVNYYLNIRKINAKTTLAYLTITYIARRYLAAQVYIMDCIYKGLVIDYATCGTPGYIDHI